MTKTNTTKQDVLTLSKDDNVRKEAQEYVQRLYATDRNRYESARKIVDQLNMGGLWRGIDIAVMLVAKELFNYSKFFCEPHFPNGDTADKKGGI